MENYIASSSIGTHMCLGFGVEDSGEACSYDKGKYSKCLPEIGHPTYVLTNAPKEL